jgi:hypothetical protein
METFKYSLDKSSKKHICPNCNKRTFVLYIDTITGEYLPIDFGRCDREQNCSYHKAPPKGKPAYLIDYLALTSITDKAYKLVDLNGVISIIPKSQILELLNDKCYVTEWYLKTSTINYLNSECKYFNTDEVNFVNEVKKTKAPEPIKPSFHNLELLDKMYYEQPVKDNLTKFLETIFTPDEVFKATQNYFISGTNLKWNKSTIFWQIDTNEKIRGAKVMLYNEHTGKRVKEPYNHINWLHKVINDPDFKVNQCLFGLHNITEDYNKTIAIVESEKTAIIMSIILPDFIWLATGSKGNFKFELLEPLKNRNVIAFPDKGEYNNWLNKATELNAFGFKISVSDLIENTDFDNGFDLADYYLINSK